MDDSQKNELLFQTLLMMFESAAMQHMGKLKNPSTGAVEKDLLQAQYAIDMLDMLKERTKGNLAPAELRALDTLIANMKLTYVDELARARQETPAGSPESAPTE